jgi:hypothetical protein
MRISSEMSGRARGNTDSTGGEYITPDVDFVIFTRGNPHEYRPNVRIFRSGADYRLLLPRNRAWFE